MSVEQQSSDWLAVIIINTDTTVHYRVKFRPVLGISGDMGWEPPNVRHTFYMILLWNSGSLESLTFLHGCPWISEVKSLFCTIYLLFVFLNSAQIVPYVLCIRKHGLLMFDINRIEPKMKKSQMCVYICFSHLISPCICTLTD